MNHFIYVLQEYLLAISTNSLTVTLLDLGGSESRVVKNSKNEDKGIRELLQTASSTRKLLMCNRTLNFHFFFLLTIIGIEYSHVVAKRGNNGIHIL